MSNKNVELKHRQPRSFLKGRDPSIDRRDRPRPNNQTSLFRSKHMLYEEEYEMSDEEDGYDFDEDEYTTDDDSQSSSKENLPTSNAAQIFLRLRPVDMPTETYSIVSPGNVLIARPLSESSSKNKCLMEKHYSFSSIFDGTVEQSDVYEMCVRPSVEAEESFTVFTYGTSGSGKTFTLLGDAENPGIVPRSLANIFALYDDLIYPEPTIKMVTGIPRIQDDDSLEKDVKRRKQLLQSIDDGQNDYIKMEEIIQRDHKFQPIEHNDVSVIIWISFVEIYNENVVDLLEPMPDIKVSASKQQKQQTKNLKIIGNDGKVFIKGVTTVYVKHSLEALKLLHYGLQKANYASTSINARSSRSHCIFMVDVIRYSNNSNIVAMSYKFCDLAGSERVEKTGNVGHRLKEAQRINTSLMVLGRCLDAANANATNLNTTRKRPEVIPYRESKLTMLLQAALLGKEKLCMVVNVTPMDKFYEENLTVLNFSSIAKNIVFKQPLVKQKKARYSFLMTAMNSSVTDGIIKKLLDEKFIMQNELDQCKALIEDATMNHLREIENLELQHQRELSQQEKELRNKLVDSFEVRLQTRIDLLNSRREHDLNDMKNMYESKIAEYKSELEDAQEDLEEAQTELKEVRAELKDTRTELSQALAELNDARAKLKSINEDTAHDTE